MTTEQLIAIRKAKGLSQRTAAKGWGVTPHTVYRWEAGIRPIPGWLEAMFDRDIQQHAGQVRRRDDFAKLWGEVQRVKRENHKLRNANKAYRKGEPDPDVAFELRRVESLQKQVENLTKENERLRARLGERQAESSPVRLPRMRNRERRAAAIAAQDLRKGD